MEYVCAPYSVQYMGSLPVFHLSGSSENPTAISMENYDRHSQLGIHRPKGERGWIRMETDFPVVQ